MPESSMQSRDPGLGRAGQLVRKVSLSRVFSACRGHARGLGPSNPTTHARDAGLYLGAMHRGYERSHVIFRFLASESRAELSQGTSKGRPLWYAKSLVALDQSTQERCVLFS